MSPLQCSDDCIGTSYSTYSITYYYYTLCLFHFLSVADVSAQGGCTITPINPTTLTAAGGVLASGTVNVMIQCNNCTGDDGTLTEIRWYDPNVIRLFDPDRNDNYVAGTPHWSRVNGADDNIILVIPIFTDSYVGTYTCGPNSGRRGPPGPPSSAVTLTIASKLNDSCTIGVVLKCKILVVTMCTILCV